MARRCRDDVRRGGVPWFLRPLVRRRFRAIVYRADGGWRDDGFGGNAGVREPRRPILPAGSAAAALPLPRD